MDAVLCRQDRGTCGSSTHRVQFSCLSVFRRKGTKRERAPLSRSLSQLRPQEQVCSLQPSGFTACSKDKNLDSLPLPLVISQFFFFCFLRLTPKGIQQDRGKTLLETAQVISITGTEFHYRALLPRRNPDTALTAAFCILRLVMRCKASTLRNKTAPIRVQVL